MTLQNTTKDVGANSRTARWIGGAALVLICSPAVIVFFDFLLTIPVQWIQPGIGLGESSYHGLFEPFHTAFLMSGSSMAIAYVLFAQLSLAAAWARPPFSRVDIAVLQLGVADSLARVTYAHLFYHGIYQ